MMRYDSLKYVVAACAALPVHLVIAAQVGHTQVVSSAYEPPLHDDRLPHYERSQENFGQFSVVRNVEDYRAVPILHGPWLTKEALLHWRDSSGGIGFTISDNGGSVRLTPTGKSSDGQIICIMQSVIVGYDPKPSTMENWEKLQPFIGRQLRSCTAIAQVDLDRAIAEMKASGSDYVAAANAWKAVAMNLFGSTARRCVAERSVKPDSMGPRSECVRYSQP